jgi:hypothetical protein
MLLNLSRFGPAVPWKNEYKWKDGLKEIRDALPGAKILAGINGGQHETNLFFKYLVRLCSDCNSECGDSRDKVYGLLRLLVDKDWKSIVPDYTKPTAQLYLDIYILQACDIYKRFTPVPDRGHGLEGDAPNSELAAITTTLQSLFHISRRGVINKI